MDRERDVLLLVLLLCVLCASATAQSGGACWSYSMWYFPDPIPPGWVCDQPGQGPFSMYCRVPNGNCPPPSWCPTCGKGGAAAGAPINLTNGNTYIQQTDLKIPGLGGGLSLTRTWNSMWPASQSGSSVGIFGHHWRSTFEERVSTGSDGYMVYSKADGAVWMFGWTSTSTWKLSSPASTIASLSAGSSYYTLTFQNGEKRLFNTTSGSLIAIIDRNGNTTQLTYDSSNRLVTVTDPALRHLYFGYGSSASRLVTTITSDVGLTLSYLYDAQGKLVSVTTPDQSTITFEYDSNALITAVKDSGGKLLESHTYDSQGRGLSSSRAGGVDAVTVLYP